MRLLELLGEAWEELEEYVEVTNAGEILRRYFAMNAFDGTLTMLGFVMGSYISGLSDARIVLTAGLSMCLAMGISGFVGAFITEKAERERNVRELERIMLTNLEGTVIDRASKFTVLMAAVVDASAPALAAMISASPFFLVVCGLLDFVTAVFFSIAIALAFLFALGVYLGRVAGNNPLYYGAYMLGAGIATSLVIAAVGGW